MASEYGVGMAQVLSCLRITFSILGQAPILLPIDINSLQQLDKMYGQSISKVLLNQHASHGTMSYHLWLKTDKQKCLVTLPRVQVVQGVWLLTKTGSEEEWGKFSLCVHTNSSLGKENCSSIIFTSTSVFCLCIHNKLKNTHHCYYLFTGFEGYGESNVFFVGSQNAVRVLCLCLCYVVVLLLACRMLTN